MRWCRLDQSHRLELSWERCTCSHVACFLSFYICILLRQWQPRFFDWDDTLLPTSWISQQARMQVWLLLPDEGVIQGFNKSRVTKGVRQTKLKDSGTWRAVWDCSTARDGWMQMATWWTGLMPPGPSKVHLPFCNGNALLWNIKATSSSNTLR